MSRPRPEPGVEYAGGPLSHQRHSQAEAIRSLAGFLGVTEERAAAMLGDGEAAAEIRSRLDADAMVEPLTTADRQRLMERRYLPPS